jgi:DNA-binding GntR family transcriptional regulator
VKGHFVVREALEVQAAVLFQQVATDSERAELRKLSARVDALSTQPDRSVYLGVHQKLHARIAQCARCPALLDAIEKTHALASIWFCVMRQPQPGDSPTRHTELVEAICSTDPGRAADAVRQHIAVSMERSLSVLEPYFRLRKATGRTFYRSDRKLKQQQPPTVPILQ